MRDSTRTQITAAAVCITVAATLAAGGRVTHPTVASAAGAGGLPQGGEPVQLNPADFSVNITNPYWPMVPGNRWVFNERQPDGNRERVVMTVTDETKKIANGVTARVVRDVASQGRKLVEVTDDWYAQDAAGNVWYLGEDAKDFENGRLVSSRGSWQWGVRGALPGIIMWADPAAHVGESYRQEYFKGEAEDWGKVIATNVTVQVGVGLLAGCVQTEDWSGIEADAYEYKYYCPMVGEAASSKRNGAERHQLIKSVP